MRKTLTLFVLAMFSVIGVAQASTDETAPELSLPSSEFFCKFRGHDFDQNQHLKCRVKLRYCQIGATETEATCSTGENFLKIECTNGFDFHSRSLGVSYEDGNKWINADDHHKIATLKIEVNSRSRNSLDADLLIGGRSANRLEGRCFYRTPVAE